MAQGMRQTKAGARKRKRLGDDTGRGGSVSLDGDTRWSAIVERREDPSFVYGVTSTGIYCRSGCPARLPVAKNVRLFPSAQDAELAGFRPCKRCRPRERSASGAQELLVARLCRWIEGRWVEGGEDRVSLVELAEQARLSRFHTLRLFKAVTGVTPREYAAARRAERVRRELNAGRSVTEAVYEAGYRSSGRFYAQAKELLGMTPTQYRRGAPGVEIQYATERCSLGAVLVAATERGVCAVLLGARRAELESDLRSRFPQATIARAGEEFSQLVAQVVALIEAPWRRTELPLDVRGTAFQQRVWNALRQIPPGTTVTYQELARRVGIPQGCRAVASACAANPVAVAIPCHRVIRSDGGLSGYRWGLERKRQLLERESRLGGTARSSRTRRGH